MFTTREKKLLVEALSLMQRSYVRSRARTREPEFLPIYEKLDAEIAALVMKVQSIEPDLEVKK